MKDTPEIAPFRVVTSRGAAYLHAEDVIAYIRRLGGSEETDVRDRLNRAADNIAGSVSGGGS